MKKKMTPLGLVLLIVLLCACGGPSTVTVRADISEYGDVPITIARLQEADFTVTPNELKELPCVERTATGATAKAGTVHAVGPLLDAFLEQYGVSMSDFKKIRFLCKDGYRAVLKDEYLTEYEVVLQLAQSDGPLSEEQQPLRVLIPEAESSYWAYGVTPIEFVR